MQTVFAVPAFKFDNQWLDGLFRPVNDSDASTSADGSSPFDTLKPVFSGYGVVHILISAFMTGITLGAYFWAKRRRDEDEHVYDDEQVAFAKREQGQNPAATTSTPGPGPNGSGHNSGGTSDTGKTFKVPSPGSIRKRLRSRCQKLKWPSSEPLRRVLRSQWRKPAVFGRVKSWFAQLQRARGKPWHKGNSGGSPV